MKKKILLLLITAFLLYIPSYNVDAYGSCCVYKNGAGEPIYFYDSDYVNVFSGQYYYFCVGNNCITDASSNKNVNRLTPSQAAGGFSSYVKNISDCSKMPQTVYYTTSLNNNEFITFWDGNPTSIVNDPVTTATLSPQETCQQNTSITDSEYVCSYSGKITGNLLKIAKYSDKWVVYYPDGNDRTFEVNKTNHNTFPSSECEDLFYSKEKDIIQTVKDGTPYTDIYVAQHCRDYDDLEQFCQNGHCKIRNALCGNNFDVGTGHGNCPKELKPIILFLKRVVFNTLKIFVPIILIIMGTIDLTKAVAANDEKAMKDASSKFVKRILTAVFMFFITTIVVVVMNTLATAEIDSNNDWKACWLDID